jgi:hypothetical protein
MSKIINKYHDYLQSLNKDYDWDAVPQRDVVNPKWHPNVDIKEIGIGEGDPVMKFKDWVGQYWLKKKDVAKIRSKRKK